MNKKRKSNIPFDVSFEQVEGEGHDFNICIRNNIKGYCIKDCVKLIVIEYLKESMPTDSE